MGKRTRALFVGNSFTARNDLPGLLAQMVESAGKGDLEWELISAGGASLRQHLNKGEALQRLNDAPWDFVALQEQSTLPVKNAARMADNVRDFDKIIGKTGARTVLYMTWARQNAPESQDAISAAYSSIGEELGSLVVPAGLAWQICLADHPHVVLHDKDKSHPSLAGSYLAACVFYVTLFKSDSRTIPDIDIGLDAADVALLKQVGLGALRDTV
jgi:hypothetical protein